MGHHVDPERGCLWTPHLEDLEQVAAESRAGHFGRVFYTCVEGKPYTVLTNTHTALPGWVRELL